MKEILMGFIAILSLTTAVFVLILILGTLWIFFTNIFEKVKWNKKSYNRFNIINEGTKGLCVLFLIILFLGICFLIGISITD